MYMNKNTNNGLAELEEDRIDENGIIRLSELKDEEFLFNYNERQAKREISELEAIEKELGLKF